MDQQLLDVDQPLNQQLLPNFRLYDESATMRVTARDLASHKTGVP